MRIATISFRPNNKKLHSVPEIITTSVWLFFYLSVYRLFFFFQCVTVLTRLSLSAERLSLKDSQRVIFDGIERVELSSPTALIRRFSPINISQFHMVICKIDAGLSRPCLTNSSRTRERTCRCRRTPSVSAKYHFCTKHKKRDSLRSFRGASSSSIQSRRTDIRFVLLVLFAHLLRLERGDVLGRWKKQESEARSSASDTNSRPIDLDARSRDNPHADYSTVSRVTQRELTCGGNRF